MLLNVLLIAATIGLTVAGQLLLKTQAAVLKLPGELAGIPAFVWACMQRPLLWVVVVMAFLAMGTTLATQTRLPVSLAYPLTSLSYVFVLIGSVLLLQERPSLTTVVGTLIIVTGVVVVGVGLAGRGA